MLAIPSRRAPWLATAALILATAPTSLALGAEPQVGAGNGAAEVLAAKSPLVTTARALIDRQIAQIGDPKLQAATADATQNAGTCVAHRANLDADAKAKILDTLKAEGLVDVADDATFPGGLMAGVFQPVRDEGTACPRLPLAYFAAPGSVFGGHHSYPGGLMVHVAVNLTSAINVADTYRRVYGSTGASGLPEVSTAAGIAPSAADVKIDQDIIIAAPIWHDWAKTIVFQWTETGAEFPELNFGGNGKTDKFGAAGDSKTGAHHIIGVAETMKRGLPPAFVVTQASAHAAPTSGNEANVVNWLRAAAILARIDPYAQGYLTKDDKGRPRLPVVRELASAGIQKVLPNETNLLAEYVLHNLSDADYTFSGPAVAEAQVLLAAVAERFGYNKSDVTAYNTKFRNPVLSYSGAERLQIIYATKGLDGVAAEVQKLKAAGVI